jgi:hypothetical protein
MKYALTKQKYDTDLLCLFKHIIHKIIQILYEC